MQGDFGGTRATLCNWPSCRHGGICLSICNSPRSRFFAYLTSMQCLFFDGVLVPAMALAGAIVWVSRGRLKLALTLTGVVAICVISYIPYIKTVSRAKEWGDVQKYPTSFEMLWNNLN